MCAGPHDVDLSCHLDVFYTVYNRVQDTPQEIPFLSILQHLLRYFSRRKKYTVVPSSH
jgi:hypothetical protein